MQNRRIKTVVFKPMLLLLVVYSLVPAITTMGAIYERVIADFESGLDSNLVLGWNPENLTTYGPYYAWEQPPSPAGDDINYWDIYSDGNGEDWCVDYDYLLSPAEDWRGYTSIKTKSFAWSEDGNDETGVRMYLYDNPGGFYYLGDYSGNGTQDFDFTDMNDRDNVSKILYRVHEGFFGGVDVNARQRTHLYNITLVSDTNEGGEIRIICIDDPNYGPPIHSTYSACVMHGSGWDRYRMYFGRNEAIDDYSADRIYLSENFGDGITGWGTPLLMLEPDPDWSGEGRLIHDPAVIIVGSTWHMYYTGTDGPDENGYYDNKVFHATSSNGVNWTRQGQADISNLPAQNGKYGYGEPSILYENGTYYLYFFSDTDPNNGTICLATGTDSNNFDYYGVVSGMITTAPEVKKYGDDYILVACSGHTSILKQVSSSKTSFGSNYTQILTTGPTGSWDTYHIGHPYILPGEDRLYYDGTNNDWTGASAMDDGKIGVTLKEF